VYRLVYQPLAQLAYPLVDRRPVLLEGRQDGGGHIFEPGRR
jgi:hypothetical protein